MHDPLDVSLGSILRGRVERTGGVTTLELSGELDMAGADPLADLLAEILAEEPAAILVDLTELTFLDSTGARLLYEEQRRAGRRRFGILNGAGPVHRSLELMGLDRHLVMVDDAEELAAGG